MALIKCPECGNQVSDHAAACPKCGYPIAKSSAPSGGTVRIKLETTPGVISQKVTISGVCNWKGTTGQVVEFHISRPGSVRVLYHSTLSVGDGLVEFNVDPKWSNLWVIHPRPWAARLRTKLDAQKVDCII